MTDDNPVSAQTATPDLVADYLADLLRSMTSLADAADLPRSANALKLALSAVSEERLRAAATDIRHAASDR